jgi:hypothetical protein
MCEMMVDSEKSECCMGREGDRVRRMEVPKDLYR